MGLKSEATGAALGSVVPGVGTAVGGMAGAVAGYASTVKGWFTGGPKSEQVEADRLGAAGWRSLDGLPQRDELETAMSAAVGIAWKKDRKNRYWTHPGLPGVVAIKIGSTSADEWQRSTLAGRFPYPHVSGEDWILIVAPVGNAWVPAAVIQDFKGPDAGLDAIRAKCVAAGYQTGGSLSSALSSVTGGVGLLEAIASLFGVR